MFKRLLILAVCVFLCRAPSFSQLRFSIATDLDWQHSFKHDQHYMAVGQTVNFHFHLTPKDGFYAWIAYYSDGKFNNDLKATARQGTTSPQEISYVNRSNMRFKPVSIGWKHYIKGVFDLEEGWNLYSYAGFGLVLGRIFNSPSLAIDTSLYAVPVRAGKGNFKRLTADLGLGWEKPLGGDIFFYTEARIWIPMTDYPSKFLFVNRDAPLFASLNFGFRLLFY
jgi:hypothetical protein